MTRATPEGTPEQQAAFVDLQNGFWQERCLEAIAVTGTIEEAARVAGVHANTVYNWLRGNPEAQERVAIARRRAGERVVGKVYRAVMAAEPEQLVRTPTAAIFLTNGLMPEWRPNGGPAVQVNVALTSNVRLDPEKGRQLAAAYFDALAEDE